jgi:hypothetical protein
LDVEDAFIEDCNIHAMGETACVDNAPIPDWSTLEIEDIYKKLNPQAKQGQLPQ